MLAARAPQESDLSIGDRHAVFQISKTSASSTRQCGSTGARLWDSRVGRENSETAQTHFPIREFLPNINQGFVMGDWHNALVQRFPLLTSLRICRDSGDSEELAAFIGVLLAAIEESRYASFCFIFPRKDEVAPLTAVLYSLGKFAVDFPKLAEEYAQQSFRKGQRVRLVPEKKVFVFGGVWPRRPGLEASFRLEILN